MLILQYGIIWLIILIILNITVKFNYLILCLSIIALFTSTMSVISTKKKENNETMLHMVQNEIKFIGTKSLEIPGLKFEVEE